MRQSSQRLRLSRGFGLLDALIALALLAFGMLALTGFQSRSVAQATESQSRLLATQLGDELVSTVLVDIGNANCYTLPQAGTCASANAKTTTDAWATRVGTALPGPVTTGAVIDATTGRYTLTITWTTRDQDADMTTAQKTRTLLAVTDVRN
jgi:type IV pilus assembly protein PilV